MGIPVKLQVFEGPLDLLLHLIDVNKIDIYDIPISLITDQYMEFLDHAQDVDMDSMSEFLVMAATLLKIKSKMLLPVDEPDDEGAVDDPRQELVDRLLEYKMFKFISQELKDRQLDASKNVFKGTTLPKDLKYVEPPVDLDALVGDMDYVKLHQIFQEVLRRQEDKIDPIRSKYGKIEQEEVSVAEKMTYIENYMVANRKFHFRSLLTRQSSKVNVIVTFLAVLELMKNGRIHIAQSELFGEIDIEAVDKD